MSNHSEALIAPGLLCCGPAFRYCSWAQETYIAVCFGVIKHVSQGLGLKVGGLGLQTLNPEPSGLQ